MMRTLLAAALVPLALGDYSYSFTDAPTAAPIGHQVYGEEMLYYQDTGDGGNVMSCSGDANEMRGGASGDDMLCVDTHAPSLIYIHNQSHGTTCTFVKV